MKTLAAACLAAALFCGCERKEAPNGPTDATMVTGRARILGWDGKPAAGARVRIIPVDYVPRAGLAKAAADLFARDADAAGEFDISSVPAGLYNIAADAQGTWYRHVPVGEYGSDATVWAHDELFTVWHGEIDHGLRRFWPIDVDDASLGYEIGFHSIGGTLHSISASRESGYFDLGTLKTGSWNPNPAYYAPMRLPMKGNRCASIAAGRKIYILAWYDTPPAGTGDQASWYELTPD